MMDKIAAITLENKTLKVSGRLDFNTVAWIFRQSLPLISEANELHFDFAKLNGINSAALSLLLEWIKIAKAQHKNISFNNLPQKLLTIAKLAGLEKTLQL